MRMKMGVLLPLVLLLTDVVHAQPVAMFDGQPIQLTELDPAVQTAVAALDAAVLDAKRRALHVELASVLIELEAVRRGVRPALVAYQEILRKIVPPTEEMIDREIAQHPEQFKGNASQNAAFARVLFQDRALAANREALFASLEKRFPVTVNEAALRSASDDTIVATAGTRKVRMAEVRTNLEAAADRVRISVREKERAAVEQVVANRFGDAQRSGKQLDLAFAVPPRPRVKIDIGNAAALGPAGAKVTIIEWGDFQCPPCGRMSHVVDEIVKLYPTSVRYVFLQHPLQFHEFAQKAAEASLAAKAQGKFFEYARLLFANQNALGVATLKDYAADLDLDVARFSKDLDGGRYAPDVFYEKERGARFGVRGTPAFFVNGLQVEAEKYNLEGLRSLIEEELKTR